MERLWHSLTKNIDTPLMFISGMIVVVGMFTLYSAANESMVRVSAQLLNIGISLGAMWIAAQIPPQTLMRLALPAYLIGIALLIAVAMFGDIVNGARRWLHVGVTRFQPSEMMKIAMPLMLAWYFQKHQTVLRIKDFIFATILLGIPAAMIMRQPDLGTALLVLAAGFYVIFLAGLPWRVIGVLLGLTAAAAPIIWQQLHDYQQRRILTLLNPTSDPLGAGYHIIQSTIAVGSGGVTGKGWLQGTQTHLEFIPERHTDFIFAVYSEEFGLVGNCILLLLYLALIGRGLMIASSAASMFGRLMAGALTLSFFTYAFVNMGMVSGILPVVGVPLPLISYGGTALVTLFLGIGILMSIHKHRKLVQT